VTAIDQPIVDSFRSRVILSDTDAAGIIYMTAPAAWAQSGFENLLIAAGLPIEILLGRDHHYPVVSFTIEHHAALTLGTPITVRTGVLAVGNRSVNIVTTITNDRTGILSCTATRIAVAKSRSGEKVLAEDMFRDIICSRSALGLPEREAAAARRGS
jgi:acyl-CoA thioesterase FadM